MNKNDKIQCKKCNKTYSSKSSLCNHNKKFHNEKTSEIQSNPKVTIEVNQSKSTSNPNISEYVKDETTKTFPCKYCKKNYNYKQSKWRHEQICKSKITEIERIKEENLKQKQQIIELQQKLLISKNLDNKSFKALNKILIERSNITNNTTINNNTINNNYQIVTLGNEDMLNVLTLQQKQQILNCRLNSLEKLVEITHCGELNQFKNIIITNLKDNYAYKYDSSKGFFVTLPKNSLLDNLIMLRVTDIEEIYEELNEANRIDPKTKRVIQDFLDRIQNEETPVIENDVRYENYKAMKRDNIKILLYNNQDKITKNITLLMSQHQNELEHQSFEHYTTNVLFS